MIKLRKNADPKELLCDVQKFDFSGHATRESICEYVVKAKPKNVVLVHGDEDALSWFEAELSQQLPVAANQQLPAQIKAILTEAFCASISAPAISNSVCR